MNKNKQSFVYLWMDSKNKMWYLGSHCGNNPTYTHSSAVMESFTMRNKPHYMKRRILAYGSNEDMVQLEHNLIERYDLIGREDYYNAANGFPFTSGSSHPNYIHGRSNDPEYLKEYRQKPEVIEYMKEYNQMPGVKKKKKEYNQRPEVKKKKKEYHQRPEVKERRKEYEQRSEVKERRKEYRQKPEVKERKKEYDQRPEMIEYRKEYEQRPEVKERRKEYYQRPEVKARRKEYMREYMKDYRQNKQKITDKNH